MWASGRSGEPAGRSVGLQATSAARDHAARHPLDPGYEFLRPRLHPDALAAACELADAASPPLLHRTLIARGLLSPRAYVEALSDHLGIPLASAPGDATSTLVIDALAFHPDEVRTLADLKRSSGLTPALCAPPRPDADPAPHLRAPAERVELAVNGLLRRAPELSAGEVTWQWQHMTVVVVCGLVIGSLLVLPHETLLAVLGVMTLPFAFIVAVRALAVLEFLRPSRHRMRRRLRTADEQELPVYSILVPLFREAAVIPDLIGGLSALDYPASKLDVMIIVEEIDQETRAALAATTLPAHIHVVVVPDGQPRTKPRALNYALQEARGTVITVYDAEDVPDPDQLRKALAALRAGKGRLGCVQARLSIYNSKESWYARQFTIEYAALFSGLLPALDRLRLPVPLGGTSNHFPRHVLEEVGGWDPYNVTEDADLGVRMARAGYEVGVIASDTWEEAPTTFKVWLPQRTRWLKGYLQTYLVHLRQPRRLRRELGLKSYLGFHVLFGGLVLSALVHPWFYVLGALDLMRGGLLTMPDGVFGVSLWMLAAFNLLVGYTTSLVLGLVAVMRRGRPDLASAVLTMPVYWLLVSLALYRALWQLVRAPHLWEKTEHKGRRHARPAH